MRGTPLGVWTGEVIKTNDIAFRLDNDDACIWSLMNGRDAGGLHWGETTTGPPSALSVLPDTSPTHRLIETRIWPSHQPPFAVLATRPGA